MWKTQGGFGPSPFQALSCLAALLALVYPLAECVKYKYASEVDCDRFSLDALYHEKFDVITEDVFADSTEFVNRITKLTTESLITILANLPGRDSSSSEERGVYKLFEETKRRFTREVNKMRRNITTSWNTLLALNHDLLLDKVNSSLESVRNSVASVVDNYKQARASLDTNMMYVVNTVKPLVRDGLRSIIENAKEELKKRKQGNETKSEPFPESENEAQPEKDPSLDSDEEFKKIVRNITMDIVPSFLGKVTLSVFERRVDLEKTNDLKAEDRDSAFDDIYFTLTLIQARVYNLLHPDTPKMKESRDTARRNLYIYWTDTAKDMYKEKMKQSRHAATSADRKSKYRKLWENEDDLADTLINLMMMYA